MKDKDNMFKKQLLRIATTLNFFVKENVFRKKDNVFRKQLLRIATTLNFFVPRF